VGCSFVASFDNNYLVNDPLVSDYLGSCSLCNDGLVGYYLGKDEFLFVTSLVILDISAE